MKKTRIIRRKFVYENFFRVEEVMCSTPQSPEPFKRFVLNRPDSAAILLYEKSTNSIILVRQFRAPAVDKDDPDMLEIPAGIIEEQETPQSCIERETLEETGYEVKAPELLYTFYPSPGISSERMHIFYAEVNQNAHLGSGGGVEGENEFIRVESIPLQEVWEAISNGKIIDGKTIVALQWLKNK